MADAGTDSMERERRSTSRTGRQAAPRGSRTTLARLFCNGTYGVCEVSSKPISKTRLEALPWARLCIEEGEYERDLRAGRLAAGRVKRSFPALIGVATAGRARPVDEALGDRAPRVRAVAARDRRSRAAAYTRNSGIAFGLFADLCAPLWAFSALASVIVLVLASRHPSVARTPARARVHPGQRDRQPHRPRRDQRGRGIIYLQWNGHGSRFSTWPTSA